MRCAGARSEGGRRRGPLARGARGGARPLPWHARGGSVTFAAFPTFRPQEWQTREMKAWEEAKISATLDDAEVRAAQGTLHALPAPNQPGFAACCGRPRGRQGR